jgi:hypothetical protein
MAARSLPVKAQAQEQVQVQALVSVRVRVRMREPVRVPNCHCCLNRHRRSTAQ